jgi:hypothetical protein
MLIPVSSTTLQVFSIYITQLKTCTYFCLSIEFLGSITTIFSSRNIRNQFSDHGTVDETIISWKGFFKEILFWAIFQSKFKDLFMVMLLCILAGQAAYMTPKWQIAVCWGKGGRVLAQSPPFLLWSPGRHTNMTPSHMVTRVNIAAWNRADTSEWDIFKEGNFCRLTQASVPVISG